MDSTEEKILPPAAEPKLITAPPHPEHHQEPRGPSRGFVGLIGAALFMIIASLFVFGWLKHQHIEKVAAADAEREQTRIPMVNVAPVRRAPGETSLLLPGNITPLTEAYIYARASGYVKQRNVDIGDRVRAGQLMTTIEAPDLDQQVQQGRAALSQAEHVLQQAKAQLDTARTQMDLAKVTWDRYQVLVQHGAIARQDADNQLTVYKSATSAVAAAEANVSAAEQNVSQNRANLDRLITLQNFEQVRAPFDGIVTARNFDVGALISGSGGTSGGSVTPSGGTLASGVAGNSGTSGSSSLVSNGSGGGGAGNSGGPEMFRVAQIGRLRILINAPQENAPSITVGQPATVLVSEFSKQRFQGRVTRTANAVDPNTRTLLTEVQVENPRQILLPGMYAQVELENRRSNPPLLVPGDALITTAAGLQVAVLEDLPRDARNPQGQPYPQDAKRIHIEKIEVGRDYGAQLEITQGLEGWEHVVVNPGDVVLEGAVVEPAAAPQRAGQASPQRRGPSESAPNHSTAVTPGASDTGGRGASEKGPGKK